MPSLNTLRTKGGVIVTIVIFIALIAFLVGDISGLFNPNKLKVGEINGKDIDYSEFLSESDYMGTIYKMMRGTDAVSAQDQETIYNSAWEQLTMKYSYQPGFERMGLTIGNAEQVDMLSGVNLSPVITSTFVNPNTGMYDADMMKMFLQQVGINPANEAIWNYIKSQMYNNRITSKYMALVANGMFVTDLEAEESVGILSKRYDAKVVTQNYTSIADSLVTIPAAEIKNYYNRHKESFKRTESRDMEYVVFDVVPSQEDYAKAKEEVDRLAEEFAVTITPMQYATLNSQGRPDTRFYKESELNAELAEIAFGRNSGTVYGPALSGDTYTISRLVETRMMPDSIGAKHILLRANEKELADSLVRVIRGGSDFATLALEYSEDQSVVTNSGDLGRFNPDEMIPEFSNGALSHKTGDVFTVETPYGLHVVQLTFRSPDVRKAQIATITYKVDPSDVTMQTAYQRATGLITNAGGTVAGFREAASQEALPRRNVHLSNTDRSVSGFENSKELVRWVFNGKEGEVSNIIELDGDYVVAAITKVNKSGYPSVEEVTPQIRTVLVKEAKAKMIADKMKGESLQAIASNIGSEIQTAADIDPNSFYAAPVGMDLRFIGAVTAVESGRLSKPVTGNMGVHVFEVTEVKLGPDDVNIEDEKLKIESMNNYYLTERTFQALTQESNVQDMRVRYF